MYSLSYTCNIYVHRNKWVLATLHPSHLTRHRTPFHHDAMRPSFLHLTCNSLSVKPDRLGPDTLNKVVSFMTKMLNKIRLLWETENTLSKNGCLSDSLGLAACSGSYSTGTSPLMKLFCSQFSLLLLSEFLLIYSSLYVALKQPSSSFTSSLPIYHNFSFLRSPLVFFSLLTAST